MSYINNMIVCCTSCSCYKNLKDLILFFHFSSGPKWTSANSNSGSHWKNMNYRKNVKCTWELKVIQVKKKNKTLKLFFFNYCEIEFCKRQTTLRNVAYGDHISIKHPAQNMKNLDETNGMILLLHLK